MKIEELVGKITNADCMEVLKSLPSKSIDLILTDPPYEVDSHGGRSTQKGLGERANNLRDNIRFVSEGFDYETVLNEMIRVCKKINIYLFCSNAQITKIMGFFEKLGCSTTLLVWHKTNAIPLANGTYHSNVEFIVCAREKGACFNDLELSKKSKVIAMPYPTEFRFHPTQKPVELIERLLAIKSNENDLVLDCYSGSGTTAIACHRTNRRFICVEKDPKYWEKSVRRLDAEQAQLQLF